MNDANRAILPCPNCGRQLGVATNHGRLFLTCPDCRYRWEWAPHVEYEAAGDMRQLFFRCGQKGNQFRVFFGRIAGTHRCGAVRRWRPPALKLTTLKMRQILRHSASGGLPSRHELALRN
jgi:hypothetical protein